MDPTREPTIPPHVLSDDAVVAYLRARAPGLPTTPFDPRAVTSRASAALHGRRLRNSVLAVVSAATAYLTLALAGPLTVPGLGTVSVPGGDSIRALVRDLVPALPPGPGQWPADVDRLETEVLPVVERLQLSYYILELGPCRVLDYHRGDYRDGDPDCGDLVPFDAEARADFDAVTDAVDRSGVAVERIFRDHGRTYVRLKDYSWQYNWGYAYLPDVDSAPATHFPGEEWTHIRGAWWFHRAHDD